MGRKKSERVEGLAEGGRGVERTLKSGKGESVSETVRVVSVKGENNEAAGEGCQLSGTSKTGIGREGGGGLVYASFEGIKKAEISHDRLTTYEGTESIRWNLRLRSSRSRVEMRRTERD